MGRKRKPRFETQVAITGIAEKGRGVGRSAEGGVIFVENVAPGDIVDVVITKKKSDYMHGTPVKFHHYSEDRVEPFCAHYEICGGCQWQHITYEAQLLHKENIVRNAMQRIAKTEIGEFFPILPAPDTRYYRNKLEFAFSNRRWLTTEQLADKSLPLLDDVLGFHKAGGFDKIINIDHCWLEPEPSNAIRNGLREIGIRQGLSFYDPRAYKGFLRQVMIRVSSIGETLVLMSFGEDDPEKRKNYLDEALERFPQITTLIYCVNTKVNDFILDLPMETYAGKGFIEEQIGHVRFRIGPKSFFQTNSRQGERLYSIAAGFAGLDGSQNVYDLYTGVGSIALYLARDCRRVTGIEEIAAAIEDARENARLNQIDNCDFYAGDVKDILTEEFAEKHGKPDVVVTDPPRAGMHPDVVRLFLRLEAPKIVYVSCNPATQARDLHLLDEKYRVEKLQPVDMFPHTQHIEAVALLVKR
ncbi:MAG: 23S rRNA (uracil(1939)-C(5))-methyltransferase RlmD [Saprospirales bacterium]|nr:23S rRNA (uracil(1939)-C(5))-methyltransferase RlmD [Saprospirales bacterium]MBK7338051.1 23S rRNA (uracil(1939)-C(5))-methyltransferase RlmD [Saprospirales bacterium]